MIRPFANIFDASAALRNVVFLRDDTEYDAVACAVAMCQSLPPLASTIMQDFRAQLARVDGSDISMAELAGWTQLREFREEGDANHAVRNLLNASIECAVGQQPESTCCVCKQYGWGCALLECGHYMHHNCIFSASSQSRLKHCPDCGHALPAQVVEARVLVPEGHGSSFDFCSNGMTFSISRGGSTPGSVLKVGLNTGPSGIFVPPVCNLTLQHALQRRMNTKNFESLVYPLIVKRISGCSDCGDILREFDDFELASIDIADFDGATALSVEQLMRNRLQKSEQLCFSCVRSSNCRDSEPKWVYNRQTCIWHSVPELQNARLSCQSQLLTLPPIWSINVVRGFLSGQSIKLNYSRRQLLLWTGLPRARGSVYAVRTALLC